MDTTNKPKTIATLDINIRMPKVERADWMRECIEEHLHCVLCGSDLQFKHKTDFVAGLVTEDAHCPVCRVRNRQSTHSLQ